MKSMYDRFNSHSKSWEEASVILRGDNPIHSKVDASIRQAIAIQKTKIEVVEFHLLKNLSTTQRIDAMQYYTALKGGLKTLEAALEVEV